MHLSQLLFIILILYKFSAYNVMGIFNCAYENTIKIGITNNAFLSNGSYIYDEETLVPPHLVGNYDYEISYNGNRRKVPRHNRACICQLKPCISLCSQDILKTYEYVKNNAMYDALDVFYIRVTLSNKSVVMKNIAQDFAPIVLNKYCEYSYMLSPETNENYNWTLFENGTLLRHSDRVRLKRSEYCFDLHTEKIDNDKYDIINPRICAMPKIMLSSLEMNNYWTQVLSIMFLLATIIASFCLPGFQYLHDKLLITYSGNLLLSFAIFSFINLSQRIFQRVPCLLMGYFNHYFQLSHYTWLAITCYDIWRTISDAHYKSSYRKYAIYGFTLPLLMTLFTFAAQNLNIDKALKPGISEDRCGLDVHKWSAVIYLFGPCLLILLYSLQCIILTSKIIGTNHYNLYLRLLLMMVVCWFFDILSYVLHMNNWTTASVVIDYINSLQGLYIFITYFVLRNVHNKIRKTFRI